MARSMPGSCLSAKHQDRKAQIELAFRSPVISQARISIDSWDQLRSNGKRFSLPARLFVIRALSLARIDDQLKRRLPIALAFSEVQSNLWIQALSLHWDRSRLRH